MSKKIDEELRNLASTDWETFMQISGENFLITVKARLMRSKGKSWTQISSTLEISPMQARTACKDLAVKK